MKTNPFQKNNSKLTAKDILSLSNKNKNDSSITEKEYIAPRNEIELKIQGFFENLLGKERIGVQDIFFQIGGNSLKATQLISQIHKCFDVEIKLVEVFDGSTIEALAKFVEELLENKEQKDKDLIVDKIII